MRAGRSYFLDRAAGSGIRGHLRDAAGQAITEGPVTLLSPFSIARLRCITQNLQG